MKGLLDFSVPSSSVPFDPKKECMMRISATEKARFEELQRFSGARTTTMTFTWIFEEISKAQSEFGRVQTELDYQQKISAELRTKLITLEKENLNLKMNL
jgi:hypothetical protein